MNRRTLFCATLVALVAWWGLYRAALWAAGALQPAPMIVIAIDRGQQ